MCSATRHDDVHKTAHPHTIRAKTFWSTIFQKSCMLLPSVSLPCTSLNSLYPTSSSLFGHNWIVKIPLHVGLLKRYP